MDKYKITEQEMLDNGVEGAAHYFNGDPDENQKIFDKLPRLIAARHNAFVEKMSTGGGAVQSTDVGYIRVNSNGYLELSADGKTWKPAYSLGGDGEAVTGITVAKDYRDVNLEDVEALKYVTRQANPRIEDYKRMKIEESLRELEAEGGEANLERVKVCAEALKYCTDVDMCPYEYPSSIYARTYNLYSLGSKVENDDGSATIGLARMTDEVVLRQDKVQGNYTPSVAQINYLREVVRNNPSITGADCAGAITGIFHLFNLLGSFDSNGDGKATPIDLMSDHYNVLAPYADGNYYAIPIDEDDLKPGDTVGWDGHVGLYVGGRHGESWVGDEKIPASPGWVVEWMNIDCGCQLTELNARRSYNFRLKKFEDEDKVWEIFGRPKCYGDWQSGTVGDLEYSEDMEQFV